MALMRNASVMAAALAAMALVGCAGSPAPRPEAYKAGGGLFGRTARPAPGTTIGVNSYLWRATLDTLAFMPLASADPYGGVIITDWYANPSKPDERLKCTVYILDARLRADGLNVTVFRQAKDAAGAWVDAPVADQTSTDIENAILTRARQLHLANVTG